MSRPSAPVISNAPLASPNTLEYWWYPPTSDGGATIEDYYLFLEPGSLTCNVGSAATYYKVTGLTNATTYFTTIAASNANGLGTRASFREFQPGSLPANGVSSAAAVAVTLLTGAALVSWTPPITLPDATIFWYVISGYTTTNSITPVVKYTAGGQTQTDYYIPSLNTANDYYFTVRAVNCPGWSVPVTTNTITFNPNPLFNPLQLNSLNVWLDAQDAATLLRTGNNVYQWSDKSGSNNHAYNPTPSFQPVISSISTYTAVGFYGSNSLSTNALTYNNSNYSVFFVNRQVPDGNTGRILMRGYTSAGNTVTIHPCAGTTGEYTFFVSATGTGWNDTAANTPTYYLSTPNIAGGVVANNILTPYYNGIEQNTKNGQTVAFNRLTIGNASQNGALFNQPFNGQIGEILQYNISLTPFNRQKVEGYLAWKWGLQPQLPTSHPFKTAAPLSNSVFSPTSFSSLQVWLDASDRSTITTVSDFVSQWTDKTSNAYQLTQTTAGSRPPYVSSLNQVTFSNDRFLNIPQASINNAATYTYCFVFTPVAALNWIMVKQHNGVNTYNVLSMTNYTGSGGGNTVGTSQFMYYRPYNAGGTASSSNALSLNTQQLITMVYDGTTFTMVRNGTQMSATAGAFAIQNATGATNFTMGVWNSGTIQNSGTTHFRMNEMLFYNRALSPNDRQTVEGYLAWKWALQGGLPLTHPYKYVSPSSNYPNSVIVPDGLYVNLTATAYSGSGTWSNIGALGTNNNASIYSGATTKNTAGNGIVFNGTNVWAFPNVYNSELTLSVWYKRTATTIAVGETAILAQQISGNNTITMCFGVGTVTSNVFFARYSSAWTQATQTVGTTIGQWVNIVMAYTNSIVTTYSNAVSLGSTNVGGLGNGGQWFIGQNWNATTPMTGEVGQVLIYNRALTAAEVLQNYTVTSNTFSV